MRNLSWIQAKINRNGVLKAALDNGSIQIVYRQPGVVSGDGLSVQWRLTVFILDLLIVDIVSKALDRLGFEVAQVGETLHASGDFLLTAAEKALIASEAKEAKLQQKEKEAKETALALKATESTVSDLQSQIEALREELELMRLMPAPRARAGAKGAKGAKGDKGEPGKDLVATSATLGDLQDVSDENPEQGHVLTWDQISSQWAPKPARMALASVGGGGGGLTVGTYGEGGYDVGTAVRAIRFSTGSGFTVVEGPDGDKEALVSLNSTFKTWKIEGQEDLVAFGEDTMHLTATGGVTLTTSVIDDIKTINIDGGIGLDYWEETETQDLIPKSDMMQDLGSAVQSLRGIYIGGKLLSINSAGELCIDHHPLAFAFARYDGRDVLEDGSDWNDVADGGEIGLLESDLTYTLEEPNNWQTPAADGGSLLAEE